MHSKKDSGALLETGVDAADRAGSASLVVATGLARGSAARLGAALELLATAASGAALLLPSRPSRMS